ncbi:hypothetical protein EIP91_010726 [Steccherinum ochraceum]|uniref:UDP-glycosyltransferases domain-containing protein n=1 Tax=Steccherinum ochraceum TaxID=92696 RepID=A0A4R0RIM3_9APHY|nr:hypothetical protein EIP91_010726 [Steccherinum ochraceum]
MARHPHIVITGVEHWGHTRPLCAFAIKAVQMRDVYVTLFSHPHVYEKVKKEMSRGFNGPGGSERLAQFVRVVAVDCLAVGATRRETMSLELLRYFESFMALYTRLLQEKPVTCYLTQTEFAGVPAPNMVVLDLIVGPLGPMLRNYPKNEAKLAVFCSGMAAYCYSCFAPSENGGPLHFKEAAFLEAERTGRDVNDVAEDIVYTYGDGITQMPGLPKMYLWEFDPQDTTALTKGVALGALRLAMYDTYDSCDELIMTSTEAYEPVALAATREWFAETGRGVWAVGPLALSDSKEAREGEVAQSARGTEIKKFMDDVVEKYGEKKMIYMSFGSGFWPPVPDKYEAFIDVLIEKRIPFIFSYASPIAQLSDAFRARVENSDVGFLSQFSPQQTILAHPAVGWFISHCGQSSTLESVSAGVPIIAWPFHVDQPANAVHLTDNLEIAYELYEVRTGNGTKPTYRTGKAPVGTLEALRAEAHEVLDKAFGEDGARKRANVQKLRAQILRAWDKGGSAEVDMTKLLDRALA